MSPSRAVRSVAPQFAATSTCIFLVLATGCYATPKCLPQYSLPDATQEPWVTKAGACAPDGSFILIRAPKSILALKFESFARPRAVDDGGGCARYVAYRADRRGERVGPFSSDTSGEFSSFDWVGGHPIGGDPGDWNERIGGIKLAFGFPACLSLFLEAIDGTAKNPEIDFATTKWRKIEDVRPDDLSLKWFTMDWEADTQSPSRR